MQTDLPEPVAPAISRCGIFAISVTFVFPEISFPTAKLILDFAVWNSGDSIRSRKATITFSLFGTSIPTAAFPGIGASIRISAAARLSLISSVSPTILLTFTPISGWISYLVTAGPQLMLVTVTLTPKFFKVCCSLSAVSRNWCSVLADFFPSPFFNRSMDGKTYALSGLCSKPDVSISCATFCTSFWISCSFFFFCVFSAGFNTSLAGANPAICSGTGAACDGSGGKVSGIKSPEISGCISAAGSSKTATGAGEEIFSGIGDTVVSGIISNAGADSSPISSDFFFLFFLPFSSIRVSMDTPDTLWSMRRSFPSCARYSLYSRYFSLLSFADS